MSEKLAEAKSALTVFMLVKTNPEWLALPVEQRYAEMLKYLQPALDRHPSVQLRWYDTEFYSARVTDTWMWEVSDAHEYELVVEELRETPLWDRYFSIVEILPGVLNAYADNYGRNAIGGRSPEKWRTL
ncbi:darcynin family protein [Mycolicibacterium sp. Y3]